MTPRTPPPPPSLRDVFEVVHPKIANATRDAAAALRQAGVRHLLVGGLAVGAHGYPRATKDVDFLVGDETFFDSSAPIVVPKVQLPYQLHGVAVDYIPIPLGAAWLAEALDHPQLFDGVPVAPVEVVLFMKLSSQRLKDHADIIELIKAGVNVEQARLYLAAHLTPLQLATFEGLVAKAKKEAEDS